MRRVAGKMAKFNVKRLDVATSAEESGLYDEEDRPILNSEKLTLEAFFALTDGENTYADTIADSIRHHLLTYSASLEDVTYAIRPKSESTQRGILFTYHFYGSENNLRLHFPDDKKTPRQWIKHLADLGDIHFAIMNIKQLEAFAQVTPSSFPIRHYNFGPNSFTVICTNGTKISSKEIGQGDRRQRLLTYDQTTGYTINCKNLIDALKKAGVLRPEDNAQIETVLNCLDEEGHIKSTPRSAAYPAGGAGAGAGAGAGRSAPTYSSKRTKKGGCERSTLYASSSTPLFSPSDVIFRSDAEQEGDAATTASTTASLRGLFRAALNVTHGTDGKALGDLASHRKN